MFDSKHHAASKRGALWAICSAKTIAFNQRAVRPGRKPCPPNAEKRSLKKRLRPDGKRSRRICQRFFADRRITRCGFPLLGLKSLAMLLRESGGFLFSEAWLTRWAWREEAPEGVVIA